MGIVAEEEFAHPFRVLGHVESVFAFCVFDFGIGASFEHNFNSFVTVVSYSPVKRGHTEFILEIWVCTISDGFFGKSWVVLVSGINEGLLAWQENYATLNPGNKNASAASQKTESAYR